MSGEGFPGFPEGRLRLTPVPNLFFSELLPKIDDLGELKITLYAFWAISQKEGAFRYLTLSEMRADELLRQALETSSLEAEEAIQEALERAVVRGTLLKAQIKLQGGEETFYFINSPKGRAAVRGLEAGDWKPSGVAGNPVELRVERPNVFTLYEQNIGPLTPIIADRLRAAEADYPFAWIEDAVRIAVENNVRKWRYIEAILEDWRQRGRDEREDRGDTEKARRRYVEGKFADFWDS